MAQNISSSSESDPTKKGFIDQQMISDCKLNSSIALGPENQKSCTDDQSKHTESNQFSGIKSDTNHPTDTSSSESETSSINIDTDVENVSSEQISPFETEETTMPLENVQNHSLKSTDKESEGVTIESAIPEESISKEVPITAVQEDNLVHKQQEFNKMVEYVKDLESTNTKLVNEIAELNVKLKSQEIAFKTAELQIRADFLTNIEKLSKECNILRKEKESIVIRYANSEKEVILEKKAQQELEKKLRDINKERENLLSKIKGLSAENNRLSSCYESKMIEIAKLQKNFDKLNTDLNSREIRIKWLQNKLKTETSAHQETQAKLDHTVHRLNEMKEEAEQVRKDCQEMIKCYQEAEEIKSVKLDSQLKQKLSELEVQKQEKSDQDQVYQLLRHELEALKKKQRMTMEENNALTLKIHSLEKERLEYEQNLSKLKDNQNMLKQEIVDLTARLAEMETLRLQLDREKEKSAASLREVERLRLTNAELQADMNACHIKEGELLKFTEGVTDTNVKLQSAHSLLEVKAQALEDEMAETKKELADMQQKHLKLASEMEILKKEHEEEVQLLARKLAEKTKNAILFQLKALIENPREKGKFELKKLNTKLDEAENENRVLKRRHIASIKELSRELYECKKRLDNYESTNGIRTESASLGSRSSSTVSLDVINSNESRLNATSPPPASATLNSKKGTSNPPSEGTSSDYPEIDKERLIERIIKLQEILVKKNDKIDFLEDHVVQLVKEMRKNSKCVDFKTV
ncbi:coiled-coil domain-containing protein [Trichonephila inaurata madagascariensis]|uniref:Coiled-coil domain-containing protein n=1 Tax=Trichonephila inaurata madagascariensis TaxID=2747483 RepID=A0A8X6XAP2_9ARAC|nr:coiled-coil domain-containing protein [Trichonephila inaurata madagascariensis]